MLGSRLQGRMCIRVGAQGGPWGRGRVCKGSPGACMRMHGMCMTRTQVHTGQPLTGLLQQRVGQLALGDHRGAVDEQQLLAAHLAAGLHGRLPCSPGGR